MKLPLLLLVLLAAPCSAQGIDRLYKQQQSDRERVLEICKKQYEEAEFWSAIKPIRPYEETDESRMRFMVTSKGVQSILPEVNQQDTGKYKCSRPFFELPVKIGVEFDSLLKYDKPYGCKVVTDSEMYRLKKAGKHPPCLLGHGLISTLKLESCSHSLKGTCLVEYKKGYEGKVTRNVLANDDVYRRNLEEMIQKSKRESHEHLCGLGFRSFCNYFSTP